VSLHRPFRTGPSSITAGPLASLVSRPGPAAVPPEPAMFCARRRVPASACPAVEARLPRPVGWSTAYLAASPWPLPGARVGSECRPGGGDEPGLRMIEDEAEAVAVARCFRFIRGPVAPSACWHSIATRQHKSSRLHRCWPVSSSCVASPSASNPSA
jgi:hypothetical protein